MPTEQTQAKPRTMSAAEEQEWVDAYALPDKPSWPGSRMYAELQAERAVSAELLAALKKIARILYDTLDPIEPRHIAEDAIAKTEGR